MSDGLLRDVRQAARSLLRNPGFSAVLIVTLALGIGMNTAIFSVVSAILLRPLPFKDPDRLIRIQSVIGGRPGRLSMLEIEDMRRLETFESMTVYLTGGQYNASDGAGPPEELPAVLTTENYFDVLGVTLLAGRTWPKDYDLAENFGVVISHGLWQHRFGGDPDIVGKKITLDAAPFYTVFGIAPAGFDFPFRADVYRSIYINPELPNYRDRAARTVTGVARLRPGVTIQQAREQLRALSDRLVVDYPTSNSGVAFDVASLQDAYVGNIRPYLVLLSAMVILVLVIACANAMSLILSRIAGRSKEIAIRTTLGAPRWVLVRGVLTESLLFSTLGAAAGLIIAAWAVQSFVPLLRMDLPPWVQIRIDGWVLLFTVVMTMLTAALAGVVPSIVLPRSNLSHTLNEESTRQSGSRRQRRLQNASVVLQTALAFIMVAGAGLMLKSFNQLQRVDLGVRVEQLLTFRVSLPWYKYETEDGPVRVLGFHDGVLANLSALPGVRAVALNSDLPLGGRANSWPITLKEQSALDQRNNPSVNSQVVSQDYFKTMEIGVLAGRVFDRRDSMQFARVAIINRQLADRLWPGTDPVGKQLKFGDPNSRFPWLIVVGVAADVKEHPFGTVSADVYRPLTQSAAENVFYLVRTTVPPTGVGRTVNQAVWGVDPAQSTFDVRSMEQRIADLIWPQRVSAMLFSGFALLALVMATIGIFGLVSHTVMQRTREFGIRFAVGAQVRDVLKRVLLEAMRLALMGIGIGLACSLMLAPLTFDLLHDVSPFDPAIFALTSSVLALASIGASYVPARRASRVDPLVALREQ